MSNEQNITINTAANAVNNEEEKTTMTNEAINTTNNAAGLIPLKTVWIADPVARKKMVERLAVAGLYPDWDKPVVKNDKLKYNANGMAICPNCGSEFDPDEYEIEMQDKAHKMGMCKQCIEQFERMTALMGKTIKISGGISSSGTREIKEGGQKASERIRAAFKFALDNNRVTEEIIENMCDGTWASKNMGINKKYAFLKDVTGLTEIEIQEIKMVPNSKGELSPRYLAKTWNILGRDYLMTNDLYTRQLEKIEATFKALGLIDDDYQL